MENWDTDLKEKRKTDKQKKKSPKNYTGRVGEKKKNEEALPE